MDYKTRPIAITDLETTGLDDSRHEIIEIGLVLVSQPDLKVLDTLDIKVKPKHPKTADKMSLKINGYKEKDWLDAISLNEAISLYAELTKDAIFCAYNVTFDYRFLSRAFTETQIKNPMDYHTIDIPSLVWHVLRNTKHNRMNLSLTARYLGIPEEPEVHRAINGAYLAYEVLKKLQE